MKTELEQYFATLECGEPQVYKHITVIPLLGREGGGPVFVTLDEALAGRTFTVTEASQSGSVPELKVANTGELAVFLLDGEEVAGAKQNRVLNTSILVAGKTELVIPVSCTERGRWAYTSSAFSSSNQVLEHKIRSRKLRSVSASLESSAKYQSDQGEVWQQIAALHGKACFHSPTHAMSDLYKAREEDLRRCLESLPLVPGQCGLLVLIRGKAAGLDTLSRPQAYARLHAKLVRSYVLDALLEQERPGAAPEAEPGPSDQVSQAKAFLAELPKCEVKDFPSVGCGQDLRLTGKDTVGTVLLHERKVIHAAVFRQDPAEQASPLASLRRRRLMRQ